MWLGTCFFSGLGGCICHRSVPTDAYCTLCLIVGSTRQPCCCTCTDVTCTSFRETAAVFVAQVLCVKSSVSAAHCPFLHTCDMIGTLYLLAAAFVIARSIEEDHCPSCLGGVAANSLLQQQLHSGRGGREGQRCHLSNQCDAASRGGGACAWCGQGGYCCTLHRERGSNDRQECSSPEVVSELRRYGFARQGHICVIPQQTSASDGDTQGQQEDTRTATSNLNAPDGSSGDPGSCKRSDFHQRKS